jgi:tetratricopeptide (TPR) repeat protein
VRHQRAVGSWTDTAVALSVTLIVCAAGAWGEAPDVTSPRDDLNDASAAAYRQGRYSDAARLARQALDAREHASGADNPLTAQALLTLGVAEQALGNYPQARALAERALAIDEKALGADHSDTAQALHTLAEVNRAMGDYARALPLTERALAIREKTRGPKHPDTAQSLHSVAELYRAQGEYAKALPAAQRALSIREQTLGPEHPDTAESLNDLGLTYFGVGDTQQAISSVQRAVALREKVLGLEHPLTAESLNNLAVLYRSQKEYPQALPLFERALAIKEKALGPSHPATATALNNLAELYRSMGDTPKALALLERAAATWEKALGPDHPNTASAVSNLGGVYWSTGDYAKAKPLLQRAAATWEKTLGPDHPDTARSLDLLAAFYQSTGEYPQALALYRRGLAVEDRTLASVFAVASEEQKLQYVDRTQGHYLLALSLIQRHFTDDPAAVRFGLELVLRRKGIVLDAQTRTREALAGHLQGETLRSWQRLTKDRTELAKLLLSGPLDQSADAYRKAVEALQESIATEEQFLSAHSGVMAQELSQRQVTADMVAQRLPPDSVLVEFVLVRDWDEKRLLWTPTSRYLAFVLTPDAHVWLVDLGDSGQTDARISDALSATTNQDFLKDVSAYTHASDEKLAALYTQVLRPIDAAVGTRSRLIVSPDGELHKLPFGALRTPDGQYLIEQRVVSYVASGRDLVRGKSGVAPGMMLVLAANPAFDDRAVLRSGGVRSRSAIRAADYQHVEYPPLPGTAGEAQAIPPLLSGTKKIYVGKEASESAVRSVRSPRVLHLATHGFFLKDPAEDSQLPDPLGRRGRGVFRGDAAGPMVRSGLALAGANHADEVAQGDDGILTALEVSDMDLYGTDLVVLSACETALGEVKAGEGVYGLRRAFVLAGARNLVMSLWPVSDKITRDQMERFYQAYSDGQDAAAALTAAQRDTIRTLREATKQSKQGEALAPVNLWAPFIVQQTGSGG